MQLRNFKRQAIADYIKLNVIMMRAAEERNKIVEYFYMNIKANIDTTQK